MNPMIKQLVNQRIQQMTPKGLVQLANQYGYQVNENEAQGILAILQSRDIDVFNESERNATLKSIAKNVNPDLAQQIQSLLNQFLP